MTNNPSLDAILDARDTGENGAETIAYIANLASEAKKWTERHATTSTLGQPGHVQPRLPDVKTAVGYDIAVENADPSVLAGSFALLLDELLRIATEDSTEARVALLLLSEDAKLYNRYDGIVKAWDDNEITLYDGVVIDRDLVVGMAV